jgi:FkbM family methyltransferase
MKLYYKNYNEYPVVIPKKSIIIRDKDEYQLRTNYPLDYPVPFCLEVDGINKINSNVDGMFDFNKTMVDIGADLGEYCWLTPFKKAIAFEPNKESVFALCANALLHDCVDKIEIQQCFLSKENDMEIRFNGFNSFSVDENTPFVKTRTLDSFNIENIGLIKIDVEMHEYDVLLGSRETIVRNGFPPIIFECFDVGVFGMTQELHDNIFGFLESYGYVVREKWVDSNTHLAVKKS